MIRNKAVEDDLVFGFAANSLHSDNRLIFVARVTKKLCDGEYYRDARYARRSDCIYRRTAERFAWKSRSLYHGTPKDLNHDLGKAPHYQRANVLLSTDFRYFGKSNAVQYKSKFGRVASAIKHLGRGHRVRQAPLLRDELLSMKDWVWCAVRNKKVGEPTHKPSSRTCSGGRSCEVL
jgi:putative DNA base modification enzyme with NMAD domain